MPTQLLTTKLYIPPTRPEMVLRPRLVERLDKGLRLSRKLTLVSAPAGFGKTTLLSEWINQIPLRFAPGTIVPNTQYPIPNLQYPKFAWLALDEGDNHPVRFWRYVIAALQTIDAAIGEDVQAALESPQPPPLEALLAALINGIVALSQADSDVFPYLLVLDDYHVIRASPIHESLNFWLDHLPPALHLVLTTRSDPPLALSRRRGRSEMTEIRATDLRFTTDEATEFFNRVMDLDLSTEDIATLEQRTEGWIVGLQMAAIALQSIGLPQSPGSMRGPGDKHAFVTAFAGDDRYVADYLMEEVLQRQPPHLQDFLLQTSILNALSAPLCDAVTGKDDSQDVLAELEQANLFVIPLDNRRDWYRYHHLFADLLRRRLSQLQGERVFDLHRRAGAWYEQQGIADQAIHHSLAAQDFEHAARLIEQHAEELEWKHGVMGWLEKLPPKLFRTRPQLCLVAAWALHTLGRLDDIEPYLQIIESYLQGAGFFSNDADQKSATSPGEQVKARRLMGEVSNIRALVTLVKGNPRDAIEQYQQTLALLPETEQRLRRDVEIGLAEAYNLEGDVSAASRAYVKAIEHSPDREDIIIAVGLMRLAELQVIGGRLRQAADTYRRMQQLLTAQGERQLYVSGMINCGRGNLLYEWNDLEAAKDQFQQGIERGSRRAEPRLLLACHISLARVLQAQGDASGALKAIQQAVQIERGHNVTWAWGLPLATTLQAQLWLAQGDVASTARWAREHNLDAADDVRFPREVEYLTLARLLIAQGDTNTALKLLERLRQAAEAGGRTGRVIEILALRALALQEQKDVAGALAALARALALAEAEGYVRLFVDEGAPMARLLYQAAQKGIAPAYAGRLLMAFEAQDKADKPQAPDSQALIEPLSAREVEVLRLVAQGLTNREIAQRLSISLGTVKVHNSNVYGKLGVNNRTQAVARARMLGLLQT
jgi:LuxR family maltose regulon positive regulatory protein